MESKLMQSDKINNIGEAKSGYQCIKNICKRSSQPRKKP